MDEKTKADLDAALGQVEALTKERDELRKRLETPEEVEKRKLEALPASLRKQIEEDRAEIKKLRDERSEAEHMEAVRKDMPQVPGKFEDIGRLLKRVKDGVSAEDFEALTTLLKAASAQIQKGGLFREIGKPGDGGADETPLAKVTRLANEHITKAANKMSLDEAYAVVFRENPELYAAYAGSVTVSPKSDRD